MRLIAVFALALLLSGAASAAVIVGVNDDAAKNAGQVEWFFPAMGAGGLGVDSITLRWDESAPALVPEQAAEVVLHAVVRTVAVLVDPGGDRG